MNPSSAQPPSNTEPREAPGRTSSRIPASLLGRVSRSSSARLLSEPHTNTLNSNIAQDNDDAMHKLRAEVERLKKTNGDLERKLREEKKKDGDEEEASPKQEERGLKKESGGGRGALMNRLDRALETNRVLKLESSIKLDEMRDRIEFLKSELDNEEWCSAAMRIVRDDIRRDKGGDKTDVMRSKYERVLREKDETIRELQLECRRKDSDAEVLGNELRDAKEELRRLKLAEAAQIASRSETMESALHEKNRLEFDETDSAAASVPKRAFRRNSSHATCA